MRNFCAGSQRWRLAERCESVRAATADQGQPQWDCPPSFHLHEAMHHDDHHGPDRRVGSDADRNGDGWICVQHDSADESIHVHIDNHVPLD